MEETTIQQDVEQEEEKDIRQQLYEKRQQQIAEESKEQLGEEEAKEEPEIEEQEEAEGDGTPPEPELVDLKVDGEIIQKTKEEVDEAGGKAAMQKQLSGEKRLKQAADERKRLARLQAELEQREQALQQREQEPQQQQGATDEQVATARRAYIDAVYSGEEEEIEKAMQDYEAMQFALMEKKFSQSYKQPDPDSIAGEVEKKVAFKTSLEDGKRQFNEKYSHLAKDPYLYDITDKATARLRRENPDWEPSQIILTAAQEVDEWYSTNFKQPKDEDLIEQRKNRKRDKETIPTAGGKKPGAEQNKKKSPREIFEEISSTRVK